MISVFVGCFAFGLLSTVASFVFGAVGGGHAHGSSRGAMHALTTSLGHGNAGAHSPSHVSPFSFSTLSAFLTWFGGAGYLLARYSPLAALAVILTAVAFGLVGGAIVFGVIARYIVPRLTVMNPDDFRVEGAVARVTSTIQPGRIGEIVYTLGGTRHADGARSEANQIIERGTQVVILRTEKGIAYVEPWTTFADANQLPAGEAGRIEKSPQ